MRSSDPSPSSRGAAIKATLFGVVLGAAGVAGYVAWQKSRLQPPAVHGADETDLEVKGDVVSLRLEKAPAGLFDVTTVEPRAALAPPPVAGRVATLDARTAPSFAPLEGRIAQVAVKLGDAVKRDEKLVLVRSPDMATLQRELKTSVVSLATKKTMSERVRRMVDLRAASQNDLLVADSELAEAELAVTSARTRLSSLNIRVADDGGYWVIAQRAGIVVQLEAAVGKQVGPDKDRPVATVADIDEVQVLADLPQREAAHVAVGEAADIREAGDQTVLAVGKVEMVSQVLDQERQTIPVRIRVQNKPTVLRPHAFVEVILTPRQGASTVVVPAEAIVSDGARSAVFAELRPGSYQRRYVRLGNRTREQVEVLGGLSAGTRIVSRGALLLLSALTTGH